MLNIKIIALLVLGYILMPVNILAVNNNLGAAFLKTGVGARMAGMGGVGAALSDNINSIYWNPAGLAGMEKQTLSFGNDDLPGDVYHQYLSYGCPWKGRTIGMGVSLRDLNGGEIRKGKNDTPSETVDASDLLLSFGYATHLSSMSSVGIVSKFIQEKLSSHDDHAFAVDMGWLYNAQDLRFALILQNMGEQLKFIRQDTRLPLLLRTGIGYTSSEKLMLGLDADMLLYEDRAKLKIGIEKWVRDNLALRAGYQYDLGNTPKGRYSLGIGLKQHDWQMDYAYAPYHDIGDAHHISITYSKENIPRPDIMIEIEDIFPSKYKRYALESAGKLRIINTTNQALSRIKVKIFIPEYMNLPTEYEVLEINPGDKKEIPMKPVLNNKIFSVDEDTPVQIEVEVEYLWRDKSQRVSSVKTTTLLNKNAIDWQEEKSIAAFVTPRDAAVNNFSKGIISMMGKMESPIENILYGIAIFSALNKLPMVYVPDPNVPFSKVSKEGSFLDTVQYPADTLQLRCGDCDDLTVLYAACLENIGIQTCVALCPGHIFLLFNTGISEKNTDMVTLDKGMYVIRNGYVWLPLEITKIDSSFFDAWEKGSHEYNSWKQTDDLKVIALNDAWTEYAPATLRDRTLQTQMLSDEDIRETVKNNIDTLCNYQQGVKDRLIQEQITWLQTHPEDISVANKLGVIYARHDDLSKATTQFQGVLSQSPEHVAAHNNLGNVYAQQKMYPLAIEEYKSALQLSPDDGGIYFNMGMAYLLMDSDESIACFRKSWELCEKNNELARVWDIDPKGKGLKGDPQTISKETIKRLIYELYKVLDKVEETLPPQDLIKQKQKKKVLQTLFAGTRGDTQFEEQAITWVLYWKD